MTNALNGFTRRDALKAGAVAATSLAIGSTATAAEYPAQPGSKAASQWWNWRGPSFDNHAAEGQAVPDAITPDAVSWRAKVPGRGHSSPVVVGDVIYLTTADVAAGKQGVLAYSRDGKPLFSTICHRGGIPRDNHPKNTEASPSVASDGEAIYASFYNDDAVRVTKMDLGGKILWSKSAGRYKPQQYTYGYAASPQIYGDSLLVVGDYDGA